MDVKLLPQAVVEIAIEEQITQVLDGILCWDHGNFRFDARPPSTCEMVLAPCRDLGQLEIKVAMLRQKPAPTA